ncbi:MAG: aldehyde ferredoxin oxidoreductase N-terminal domain-containing protein, partial [Dehalococcoidales bacterium]
MYTQGYGQILDIDLSTGRIKKTAVDSRFARKYIGGGGFGHKILFDEVGPEIDPYSPENIVVFANGPFTGTKAPCGGRTEVTTIHPLTGNIGTGNTGGIWGAVLKHAGFDVIIVRNRAEKPVYLWIDDDTVEIRDAGHLWGKDARVTSDILREELSRRVSVMAIGQAGENLVRYALVLNDYY